MERRSFLITTGLGTAAVAAGLSRPVVASASGVVPVGGPKGIRWRLKFRDEFRGTSLNRAKWSNQDGGHMNNVTTHASNVAVRGGLCSLTLASRTSGAEICTTRYLLPVGGYAEARMLFPGSGRAVSNWPAWWASGPDWPNNGENDIAEGLGTMTVNYHSASGSHNHGTVEGHWAGNFHVYGLWRGRGRSSVYFNGKLVKTYATDDRGGGQNLIANVGSGNRGVYGAGCAVKLDYVRAWQPT